MKLLPPVAVFIVAHLLVIGGAIVVASQSELSVLLTNTGDTFAGGLDQVMSDRAHRLQLETSVR
jgi:hypothetical protein